ncbi:PHP domain-containing protein [Pseudomonadales bacterium]|nr:PHP domain-containing protein [Pseudomonadales bacterium]
MSASNAFVKADFHMHSRHSDGSLSPQALIELACEREVTQMAITDHDTISAYAELAALPETTNKSVKLITGCEFSCLWSGRNIHVVGLNLNLQDPGLTEAMEIQAKARTARAQTIADILSRQGFENSLEGAQANAAGGTIGRPHFAQYLIDAGHVKNMKQAFK